MSDITDNTNTTGAVEDGVYYGQLETVGDVDWVAVELTAGVTYTVRVLGSDSDNGTAQYLRILDIYNADGIEVPHTPEEYYTQRQAEFYFTTEAQSEITPTTTGTYYISVDGWGGDLGSYTVFVTQDQFGGNDDESLTGSSGADSLQGGYGDDTLSGGDGSDYLDGEWGDDVLTGGAGADTFRFYSDNWDDIRDGTADLWGNDTITDFDPGEDTLHFAGRIVRNLDDFTITEQGGNTTLTAYWGDSVTLLDVSADELTDANIRYRLGVRPLGGNLEGAPGADSLVGTDADDVIYGHGGNDTLVGGDGFNYLRGFAGDDLIIGGNDVDVIGGEEGDDIIRAGGGDDFIVSNEGDDSVLGGAGNDLIETSLGEDTLHGGAGNDTLRPGRGDDLMSGGSGRDMFVIGRTWGDDTISDFSISHDTLDFRGTGLDIDDLTVSRDANNTVVSDGTNSLTLVGVDTDAFNAAKGDLILEPGSVTSHYTEYSLTDAIGDSAEDILATTSVINDGASRWTPDEDGITRVSYSFANYNSLTVVDENSEWWTSAVEPVTPMSQYALEQEIARVESYANIELVWVEDYEESAGNIRISNHEIVVGGGSTTPYDGPYSADVLIGVYIEETIRNKYFVHELGHSLGFDDLPDWNEFTGEEYTIMSYVVSARHADAQYTSVPSYQYMYADIAGLQYLYGVNTESTAGNTTFTYDLSLDLLETIFDAGGVDTIQVTGTGDPVHINLTPGSWSNIGPDIDYTLPENQHAIETGTLFIMPNTVIENARSSIGNDTLTGNDADNTLIGMDGSDLVYGGLGSDTVWAGGGDTGSDTVFGGGGADLLAGGAGDDLLVGNAGADIGFGGSGDDTLVGGDWNDGVADTSDTGASALWAGDGNDLIRSANGNDELGGGLGNDSIYGAGGNDVIYAGKSGADHLFGGAGDDIIFGSTENDRVTGGLGNDELYGGADNDTVTGNSGEDTLYGGAGNDLLTGSEDDDFLYPGAGNDTLVFADNHGDDIISGFSVGEDALDLSGTVTDFAAASDITTAATETTIGGAEGLRIDTGGGNSIFLAGLTLDDIASLQISF